MRNWYKLVRTRCPTCGQTLAVEAGQVRRSEVVTCQNCNTDLRLLQPGARPPEPSRLDDEPPPVPLEVAV